MPLPPPEARYLRYGTELHTPIGVSTVLADMDFETYSEAGFLWDDEASKWVSPAGPNKKKGLSLVGMRSYAEHPTTEVLCFAYDLKDGLGPRVWTPHKPPPTDLFGHLAEGKLVEAFNVAFEECIWSLVCVPKYGWPELPVRQLRCAAAKSRAYCLPPDLNNLSKALNLEEGKDSKGKSLINKLCIPRKPTKKIPERRLNPQSALDDFGALIRYCVQDIVSEATASSKIPDLSSSELEFWLLDQQCNREGLLIDLESVSKALEVLEAQYEETAGRVREITSGEVSDITEVQKIIKWLGGRGVVTQTLDENDVISLLESDLPSDVKELLTLRARSASASVKKFRAMQLLSSSKGRVHDCHLYHGARTGRDVGRNLQTQNMVSGGPDVRLCECGRHFEQGLSSCPFCGLDASFSAPQEWSPEAADSTIRALNEGVLSHVFKNPVAALSGCVRGMVISDEGCDFIGSDYSAIEAVVAAAITGEEWRLEVFRSRQDIYLASVSRITGIPVADYIAFKDQNGQHHKDRKVGKVAELASGFGGWVGSWVAFGAGATMSEDEIKKNILAWRKASPKIVEAWGGQTDGMPWEGDRYYYGLEGAFLTAFFSPGKIIPWKSGVSYVYRGGNIYCQLPSGRYITYHNVALRPHKRWEGLHEITFDGWNTNPKMGAVGWTRLSTYGGRLFENVVQATARDILAHAAVNLQKAGYSIRLRVHDELVANVPEGWGSTEEFEGIMSKLPCWASGWPIRAAGGWRGKRFRK